MATDSSHELLVTLGRILDRLHRIDGLLWQAVETPEEALFVAQNLLGLYEQVDTAFQWIHPDASIEEILGVPAAMRGTPVAEHADHPGWDFGPWVAEKLTQLKQATRRLVQTYGVQSTGSEPSDASTEAATLQHQRYRDWTVAEHYAHVVYDQIYEGHLRMDS